MRQSVIYTSGIIPLTLAARHPGPPPSVREALDKVDHQTQVVQPEGGSPGGDHDPRVRLEQVCPGGGKLAEAAGIVDERHQIVPPGRGALEERKLASSEWVERMGHAEDLHLPVEHRSS